MEHLNTTLQNGCGPNGKYKSITREQHRHAAAASWPVTLEAESVHEVVGGRGANLVRVRVRVRVRVSSQRAAVVPSVKVALYSAHGVITT